VTSASTEDATGYALPLGTIDQARALIGKRSPRRTAAFDVSWGMIQHFCAMTRDANASYWDPDFAAVQWGGVVAPPAMLLTWLMTSDWSPSAGGPEPMLPARIPLPGTSMVNGSNDTTFHLPVRIGDRLSVEEELVSVSDLKSTRLGDGHFLETLSVVRNQDDALVAEVTNVLFRFTPRGDA
jgi:acyl dehydratase